MKFLGMISVGFCITDQLLMRYFYLPDTGEKWEYKETVHQLFADIKKTYNSGRREVLYNILIEFCGTHETS
jgi:hypothetical protein